jgi:hypothetical protein
VPPLAGLIVAAMLQTPQRTVHEHHGYFQTSVFASVRPGSSDQINRLDKNLSGSTVALALSGGVTLSRSFGLEGEVVFGGTVAAQQSYTYMKSSEYTAENQQILVNALLRFRPGGSSFELVGGGGYGHSIDRETSRVVIDEFGGRSSQPDISSARNALTLTGGADFAINVASHVAIVPGLRVRWLQPQDLDANYHGVGAWTFEFGASVRIR